MITVKMDEEKALDMLMDRLAYWTDDATKQELFEKMYNSYVYGGVFDGGDFDVMAIVDNDYVNNCVIYEEGQEEFDELLKIYQKHGAGDCSCETDLCSFIEAVDDEETPKMFLVRC